MLSECENVGHGEISPASDSSLLNNSDYRFVGVTLPVVAAAIADQRFVQTVHADCTDSPKAVASAPASGLFARAKASTFELRGW